MASRWPTRSKPVLRSGTDPTPSVAWSDQAGVAFLLAIVALSVMGLLATAGFYTVRQEWLMGTATQHTAEAQYRAEDGIAQVLAQWQGDRFGTLPVGGWTVVTDSSATGRLDVRVSRRGPTQFFLESHARVGSSPGGPAQSVGVMTRLQETLFEFPGALIAEGPIGISGTAEVHGEDAFPTGWAGLCSPLDVPRAGVVQVEDTTLVVSGAGQLTGFPPKLEDTPLAQQATHLFGDLDWNALSALADKALTPGRLGSIAPASSGGSCRTQGADNWGDPLAPTGPCGSYFPIVLIPGDAQLDGGGRGQGILLVDGSLTISQPFLFTGIIIVRGTLHTSTSGVRLYGSTRAERMELTSTSPSQPTVLQRSTCAVHRAVQNHPMLTRAVPLSERAWVNLTALGR